MKRPQNEAAVDSDDDVESDSETPQIMKPPVAKKLKKAMDREFNVKEISKLKKVETLFDSSILRMQVSELLKNISLRQKFQSRIESAVVFLSKKLLNLPSYEKYKISDRSWIDGTKFKVALTGSQKETKGVFQFAPPSNVRLIGSVSLETSVKPHVEVDLALFVPKDFFQCKDNLNQRFMKKKALYLCALASHLSKLKKIENLSYSYHMGNPCRPVLVVTLKEEDFRAIDIKLHVVPEEHPFKLAKFHISKNNVQPKWFFNEKSNSSDTDEENGDECKLPATKMYNSSVLQDLSLVANEDRIKDILSGNEGLRHGIMLLKLWLRQRELAQGLGMFSNFLMTAYVAFLTKTRKLNKMMKGFQVFKTTLQSLSKSDWHGDPPSLCEDRLRKNLPDLDDYRESFDCVFVDCTGSFNLAYMLNGNVFERVKTECRTSLDLLEQPEETVFDALFRTPAPFVRSFDHIFHIKIDTAFLKKAFDENPGMKDTELDVGLNCRSLAFQQQALDVLKKALGKRVTIIQAQSLLDPKWHVSEAAFDYDSRSHLTFGIVLDPSEAHTILNKGPPADAPEALQFRAFWKEKSEMRRFKDGTIHEAVLWSSSPNQSDKRVICRSIVLYILKEYYGVDQEDVVYRGNNLDPVLQVDINSSEIASYGTGEECSISVLKAFEQINRIIRGVSDLPLSITSVQGVHAVFRHAEVFPPLPTGLHQSRFETVDKGQLVPWDVQCLPPHMPVLPVVCGLEDSGKWPDDREAFRYMKVMLHLKLGQELREKYSLCVRIHPTHIDAYQNGYVFRLILTCSKEILLLKTISESGMVRFEDTKESLAVERDTVAHPLLSHLIHSVQQEHYVFSATVRLCKRWLASQMIWDQLREEAVELMVAYVFISPHPFSAPASPAAGFMRFLHLFSTFDWKTDILFVDLNKGFSGQDYASATQDFKKHRASLPALCIATPQDKKGTVWTKNKPKPFILDRLVVIAAASLKNLEQQVMSIDVDCDFKKIFRPVYEHFDLVIHLKPGLNVLKHQAVDAKTSCVVHDLKTGLYTSKNLMPVLDFNVFTRFVHDLKALYDDFAHVFFDCLGGSVIGLVWKSQAFARKDFKISNFPLRRPAHDEDKVTLEAVQEAILEEVQTLGSGIIETIVIHR